MKSFGFSQRALVVFIAGALLSGCGQMPLPSGAPQGERSGAGGSSWVRADAKTGSLLYVSDGSSSVYIYSYPQLKLTGTLKGFSQPLGECVNKNGDVWIANFGAQEIDEYAHGSTKRMATLKTDADHTPYGCSVNSKTNDLAVSTWRGGSGPGYLSIYKQSKGTPKTYSDAAFVYAIFPGYDGKGNVFLDGVGSGSAFRYAELPSGKTKLVAVSLKQSIGYPGEVQFDGKYVAVGDQIARAIYQTTGGKVNGTTTLGGSGTLFGYFIAGKTVFGVDAYGLGVYNYPGGGSATNSITIAHPFSVVLSVK
ncbi:MAG: hypothetical protein WBE83_00135 [Candidatus Cybelea sp.]